MTFEKVMGYVGAILLGVVVGAVVYGYLAASYRYSDAVEVWVNWGQQPGLYDGGTDMVLFVAWALATAAMLGTIVALGIKLSSKGRP